MIDSVKPKSTGNVECYDCDGIFKKSFEKDERLESKIDCNMPDEAQKEKEELLEEFDKMPSHPTSKDLESYTSYVVKDS